jgi:hypothetical protein
MFGQVQLKIVIRIRSVQVYNPAGDVIVLCYFANLFSSFCCLYLPSVSYHSLSKRVDSRHE